MSDQFSYVPSSLPGDVETDCCGYQESRVPTIGLPHKPRFVSPSEEDVVDCGSVMDYRGKLDTGRIDSGICDSGFCPSVDGKSFSSLLCAHSENEESGLEYGLHNLDISDSTTNCSSTITPSDNGVTDITSEHSYTDDTYFSVDPAISEDQKLLYRQDDDGDSQLHLAIIHGNSLAENIIELTPSSECLNMQNELRQTPLHLAVLTSQPVIVRKLVIWGASLEVRDRHGNTPLHCACSHGTADCIQALTVPISDEEQETVPYELPHRQIPQDFDIKNYEGESCLHSVLYTSCVDTQLTLFRYLIDQCHADINSMEGKSGRTLLHHAAETCNLSLLSFLLEHPALRVDARTYSGQTPLWLANSREFDDVTARLIARGADASQINTDDYDSSSDSEDDMMDGCGYNDFSVCGQPITAN